MSVKIVGIDKLQKKLRSNLDLSPVKKVVSQNGSELQTKAQRNSPVDTGTLRRSIGLSLSEGGLTAKVAPTAEYAPYVELGTRFQEAQPFIKPAFTEQKEIFKRDLKKLTE